MRKINRIIGSMTAATLAIGATSAYVAFADETPAAVNSVSYTSVSTTYPTSFTGDKLTSANKVNGFMSATVTTAGKVTVTFTKTKAEIQAIVTGDENLNKGTASGGVDPVYLNIDTNIANTYTAANFAFDSGYGWDDANNKAYNFEEGNIKLWLPAILTGDTSTIKYKVASGTQQTITVEYKYADTAAVNTVTYSGVVKDFPAEFTGDKKTSAEKVTSHITSVAPVNGEIVVTFDKTKAEIEAIVAADEKLTAGAPTGVDPVYLNIATSIPTAVVAGADNSGFVFTSGYGWDEADHSYNFASGYIKLWLPAIVTGDTKTIGYKVNGGTAQELKVKYVYAADTTTPDPDPVTPGTLTPATPVEPVAPSNTSNTSTTTSDATSSAAATVAPVEAKGEADVKLGDTAKVDIKDLGEVTVAADKEDTALQGAKLEVEATNNEETTAKKLDAAVGANASADVKAEVEAAEKAVKDGDAVTLDISFKKDGKDVKPGKDVTVTAPVPAALKGADKLYVYHVTDKGLEDVTAKCKYDKDKGTIAITNDAFSPYIISKVEIKAQKAATSEATTSTPATSNGNPNTGVALAIAPIVLAGAAVAVISVKKRK